MKRLMSFIVTTLIVVAGVQAKSTNVGLEQASKGEFLRTEAANKVVKNMNKRGSLDLFETEVRTDSYGNQSVRQQQYYRGLEVFGAQMITAETPNGLKNFGRLAEIVDLDIKAKISADQAISTVSAHLPNASFKAELMVYPGEKANYLTWVLTEQSFTSRWLVFVNAKNGDILNAFQSLHAGTGTGVLGDSKTVDTTQASGSYQMVTTDGRVRTYSANNGTSLPGTLQTDSDDVWTDGAAVDAHRYAADVLKFYDDKHNRNSFDGNGATVKSTVHYSSNYVNAFWNGTQMVYGDGDGTTAVALSGGFDVVGHEITHAVTEKTSNLVYQNESGALNEAFSDIMGAQAEFYIQASKADWLMGEDIWTPATSGDALRYMNNPTQDGSSTDHYDSRYTGSSDNGGVHWNSGIANLAFVLLSDGGSHPRLSGGPTVAGLGVDLAGRIFFDAFTTLLSSGSTFSDAREACMTIAANHGSSVEQSVSDAWEAVGVTAPVPPQALSNGESVAVSGSTGNQTFFTLDVPSGASNLNFSMSGGSGDGDLYVKFGSNPSTGSYDYRSWNSGNSENIDVASPSTGTYHILVHAYSTFSGCTLTVSFDGGGTPTNQAPTANFSSSSNDLTASFSDQSSDSDGSIASWSWNFGDGNSSSAQNPSHTYASAGTYTVSLTVTDNDGATDSHSASVTVTAPPQGGVTLSVRGYKVRGRHHGDLTWSGASTGSVDVYRNGTLIATVSNSGSYTDAIGSKGGGVSFTYQICESGGSECSNEDTITF